MIRTLIVEDDYASRKFIQNYMLTHGTCDVTVNGAEAIDAFLMSLEEEEAYDLICLDVMMPIMDGYQVLQSIRKIESEKGIKPVKIIMMTALNDEKHVKAAFDMGCTVYSAKPIDTNKLEVVLKKLNLI